MRRTSLHLAVAGVLAAASATASAAEWRITPEMSTALEYYGNPRLIPQSEAEYASYRYEIAAPMSFDDGRTWVGFTPRYIFASFPEDEVLDRSDGSVSLALRRRYETALWSASADFVRDSTLTSELGVTGFQEIDRPHEAITVNIAPTALISDRAQLGMEFSVMEHRYPEPRGTSLVDYRYAEFAPSWSYAFAENLKFTLRASRASLSAPEANMGTEYLNAAVAIEWQWSPLWHTQLSAGPSRTESNGASEHGYVYGIVIGRDGERSGLDVSITNEASPSGRGTLVTRDEALVRMRYALSPYLEAAVVLHATRNEDALADARGRREKIEYQSANASLTWRMAEHWSVTLSAGGRTLDDNARQDSASGYITSLTLLWRGGAHALAR